MLADRNVGTSSDAVTFFGERTMLPAGPALIARRTGAALLPAYSYRVGNTRSVAVAWPAVRLPEIIGSVEQRRAADTQAVASLLEKMIHDAPDQWAILQPVWPRAARADRAGVERGGGVTHRATDDAAHRPATQSRVPRPHRRRAVACCARPRSDRSPSSSGSAAGSRPSG